MAAITPKRGDYYLGLFDDEVEAAKACDWMARGLYGEHPWLNFPPENSERGGQERVAGGCYTVVSCRQECGR